MKQFTAPWSRPLVLMTFVASFICLGTACIVLFEVDRAPKWVAIPPMALIFGGALFCIRGYIISGDAIFVRRLFWSTRLSLAGLKSAGFEPDAMGRSVRTFGNGGFFSFTGFFRNRKLGSYRAYVTDPRRAVVLRFANHTVVLSPDKPEAFVGELQPLTSGV